MIIIWALYFSRKSLICGETFKAQCDLEPVGCPTVWLLLMMSIALHVVRCCVYGSGDDDDEDEVNSMYT